MAGAPRPAFPKAPVKSLLAAMYTKFVSRRAYQYPVIYIIKEVPTYLKDEKSEFRSKAIVERSLSSFSFSAG